MAVRWLWAGGQTPEGFTVSAKLTAAATTTKLKISPNPDFSEAIYSTPVTPTTELVCRYTITGLAFDTQYFYAVEIDGVLDLDKTGQVRTSPEAGAPADILIVAGGDAGNNTVAPLYQGDGTELAPARVSNHPIFDTVKEVGATEFWHLGDLHYYDPGSGVHVPDASIGTYRTAYDDVMHQSHQAGLFQSVGTRYVWDDHDFGPNNSDATSPGRDNACLAYREIVPHGPLGAGSGPNGIYQTWTLGRVQVLAWDSRADRSPNTDAASPLKTMLGTAQKEWFSQVLASSPAKALVIISPSQWWNPGGDDSWNLYEDEQAWIIDRIEAFGWTGKTIIVSADVHSLAIDTGTNSPGGIPVYQFASFDSNFGSPQTHYDTGDSLPGRGQYGTLRMLDLGHEIRLIGSCMVGTSTWRTHTHVVAVESESVPTDPTPPPVDVKVNDTVSWVGCDLATGKIIADLPDMSGSFGRRIGNYTSVSLALPPDPFNANTLLTATQPGRTLAVPVINGLPAGSYIPLTRALEEGPARIAAVSPEGYFERRHVTSHVWTDADSISVVAAGLIRDGEDLFGLGRGLGLLLDATPSGKLIDRTYVPKDRQTVYSALREIMADEGVEWTIDTVWRDETQTSVALIARLRPQIGTSSQVVFESKPKAEFDSGGGSVASYTYTEDYSSGKGANYVVAYGTGEGEDQPESNPAVADDLLTGGWPLYELEFSPGSNITKTKELNNHAKTQLKYRRLGTNVWTLQSQWDSYPRLVADYALGDDVGWNLKSDWHPDGAIGKGRVIGWDVSPEAALVDVTIWTPGEEI